MRQLLCLINQRYHISLCAFLCFLFFFTTSCLCTKTSPEQSQSWIQSYLSSLDSMTDDKPLKIDQYVFRQDTLYYMSFPCCDRMSRLYDQYGKELCRPDGGITGMGDGKCPDFRLGGSFIRTLWQEGDPQME